MVKCILCNGDASLRLKVRGFEIYKCKNCKVSFLYPVCENQEKLYNNNYFEKWYIPVYKKRKEYFKNILKNFEKLIPPNGKVLDVGLSLIHI